jgi:hypothetical protein
LKSFHYPIPEIATKAAFLGHSKDYSKALTVAVDLTQHSARLAQPQVLSIVARSATRQERPTPIVMLTTAEVATCVSKQRTNKEKKKLKKKKKTFNYQDDEGNRRFALARLWHQ